MSRTSLLVACVAALCWTPLVVAHTVITYPGWRGNNLHTNGTNADGSIPTGSIGIDYDNGTTSFPYGMQWMYPCGGLPTSTNRTKWPVSGGAVGVQPGWFSGHSTALMYINLGLGTEPLNMSHIMTPVFQINGPSNNEYPGEICIPQVPLPANISVKIGDNATIQVVEAAKHGAALYSCVDITFADPADVAEVNETNCRNTTAPDQLITFDQVFATSSLSGAQSILPSVGVHTLLPTFAMMFVAFMML
ncbi:uncharacterized protein IWZ02DRAFT_82796 [Phyllosticta citriasiana]|uniref:Copper acquisition factor BIM1-like domain-containing protein n=1 Tax=Phyllosticta citriasiana TaxID=595635 RepID=A0ABR1KJH8_9PEZI